ncbi:MAG: DNA polymerase IV [Bacteroidota bacterium]
MRKIIHVDMDAFYASVEQRDFPEYRGKAIVISGPPDTRSVTMTASYEARKYGVKSAMPARKALELCPHIIFVPPRFAAYKEASNKIREIFHRYTDLIEPLSLDEAYLDVTEDKLGIGSALEIAKLIKDAIHEETGLTASAGVSINKFLAKVASDLQKPNGLTFIGPSKVEKFMEQLPVEKFFGVGKVTAERLNKIKIFKGIDIKQKTMSELNAIFGKNAWYFYNLVRGIDNRPVVSYRDPKSIGAENTFTTDTINETKLNDELDYLANKVFERCKKQDMFGKTLTLKVKYFDFTVSNRSITALGVFSDVNLIFETATALLSSLEIEKKVRLLGITISNFNEAESPQLKLFGDDLF